MIIQGLLMDGDDVIIQRSQNPQTQLMEEKCRFKLMTSKPTAVLEVSLTPEQIKAGVADDVRKLAGQQINWEIEYRSSSFGDNKTNQHRSFNGFRLFRVPERAGK